MSAVQRFRDAQPAMLTDLATLVAIESPSADTTATAQCAEVVADLGARMTGQSPEHFLIEGRTHLRWRFGDGPSRVVLLGHLDTVWPLGTVARWPFRVDGDRATGPGVEDMKAGLVLLFHALTAVEALDGVAVVVNSDEELGSVTSRGLIEETARGAAAALILEGSNGGALKTARKGIAHYSLLVTGRASHAGVAPHLGVNAGVELAHQVLALAGLGDAGAGTSVTPTNSSAGTTSNTVPAQARVNIDVRAVDQAELSRVDAAIHGLAPVLPGAALTVLQGAGRAAMPASASAELAEEAQRVAADLGLAPMASETVGGVSDGNLTAAMGVRTLDGLGAVGGNAHAEGEWIDVPALPERAALLAGLVARLSAA